MTVTKNVPKSLANNRLDKVAASLFPDFSRTQIKKWILDGRILINGDLSKPKDMTVNRDNISIFERGLVWYTVYHLLIWAPV